VRLDGGGDRRDARTSPHAARRDPPRTIQLEHRLANLEQLQRAFTRVAQEELAAAPLPPPPLATHVAQFAREMAEDLRALRALLKL
jgi:hypothetical protein